MEHVPRQDDTLREWISPGRLARPCGDRFKAIVEGSGNGLWDWEVGCEELWVSGRLRELLGLPANEDSPPARVTSLVKRIHPADVHRTLAAFDGHLKTSSAFDVEFRFRTMTSGYRWFRIQGAAQRDAEGRPVHVAGSLVDIHVYKVAEAREAARAQTLTLIAKGTPLHDILETIVRGIEAENPRALCSVLLLDKTGKRLMTGAAPRLPDFYNKAINGVLIGPDVGSCGTAAWTGKRVISEDIQNDVRWRSFRDLAARAGLGACWSEPIIAGDGRVLGTFAIYKRRANRLETSDLGVIAAAGQFAAIAIEHKYAEDALRWRTAFFEAQADSSYDGILVVDSEGKKVHQNRKMVELWKIPPQIARDPDDAAEMEFISSRTRNPEQFGEKVAYLREHPSAICQDEIELLDGTVLDRYSSPVMGVSGEYYGRIWRFRDITQGKAMEEKLRAAALSDGLTSLPNRALLLDRLQSAIERHKRFKELNFGVLFIDFDRFKLVNDSLGHEAGDQLLREIALRLLHAVRAVDVVGRAESAHTVSRLGGDEFVVLLDVLRKPQDAMLVANRTLETLSKPYSISGHEIVSTASIGIVTSQFEYQRAEDILRDADTAMYEAKNAGKARAELFDETMQTRLQRKMELENGLRKALDAGQFVLHYQPIIALDTGKLAGVEALLRWQHPDHGMISPGEFIPIAEETHLIVPLGEFAFRQACTQLAAWRKTLGADAIPSLNVNVSRAQLRVRNLAQQFVAIARQIDVDPALIHLEITETAIMGDAEQATPALRKIKAAGFKIDMDDFGIGYSSLSALQQLPIDVLKIDRSFIANLARGQTFTAMVSAIIRLARDLSISVVAEGVETADQASMLRSLSCGFVQVFLYSRPLAGDKVEEYVRGMGRAEASAA